MGEILQRRKGVSAGDIGNCWMNPVRRYASPGVLQELFDKGAMPFWKFQGSNNLNSNSITCFIKIILYILSKNKIYVGKHWQIDAPYVVYMEISNAIT